MNVLRNATQPVNTQQLIDVLEDIRVNFRPLLGPGRTQLVTLLAKHGKRRQLANHWLRSSSRRGQIF